MTNATAHVHPYFQTEVYNADSLSLRSTFLGISSAGVGAFVLTLGAWKAMKTVSLPAFSTSMVTRALATVGIVGTLVAVAVLLGLWILDGYRPRKQRPQWRTALTYVVAFMAPAALVISAVGMPLSATRLWLDGIQVDQVFRTQFLTRAAEQGGYADMNYLDMPTFYPLGWFWLGGRLAAILNMPGWEVYQPWSLISIAVAGSILVPVWQRLVGSLPVATAIALVTTAITLVLGAEEPYSAVIAMGVPAIAILCGRAFNGSWAATFGVMIYLGISASFYTLYTGAVALTVVTLIALSLAAYERTWVPIFRLAVMGIGSLAIAAVSWAPYILAALRADAPLESAAQHYLPAESTQIPVPFLAPSVVGILCFIGIIFLVMRISDRDVRALAWALGGIYLWVLASMILTLTGTTLLGFRLELVIVLLMATAGVLAIAEIRLMGVHYLYPSRFDVPTNRGITIAFIVVLLLSGIHYAQQIPAKNESGIDHAYTDTDGYGERADRYTSDAGQDYARINEIIQGEGYAPTGTVIMTDEKAFMAFNAYHGFNAFTAHYANPLGEFSTRNDQMEQWATASWGQTPEQFREALDAAKWKAPDAIIFRGSLPKEGELDDGYKLHLAEDIYPNHPNVRYRAVFFNPGVFKEGWTVEQVGPFVVAVRHAG